MNSLLKKLNHNLTSKHRHFVKQQHPKFAVLACSDSRVDVEDLFGDTYNNVFVIENAGNTASNNRGTIGYALEHLQVEYFVVVGHSNCGACKYGFDTKTNSGEEVLDQEFKDIKELALQCEDPKEVEIHNIEEQVFLIKHKFPQYAEKIMGMYYDMKLHKLIQIV